jgi:hypothetical protein
VYLTAFLIVAVLSAVVSLRRSMNLSRNSALLGPAQRLAVRRRAIWPAGCGLTCMLLGWIVLHFVQDKLVLSVIIHLTALSAAFFGGWFFGFIGGMDWD